MYSIGTENKREKMVERGGLEDGNGGGEIKFKKEGLKSS